MALKATIYKANLSISDMDRGYYGEHSLTVARHPSETDERMMMRVLAFAMQCPADDQNGTLDFAKGLFDVDEPELWHKDLTGAVQHWIDMGLPDLDRMKRVSARATRCSVWTFASSTPVWWDGVKNGVARLQNLSIYHVPSAQSLALAKLTQRTMQLQIMVQDGTIWVSSGEDSVEIQRETLKAGVQ